MAGNTPPRRTNDTVDNTPALVACNGARLQGSRPTDQHAHSQPGSHGLWYIPSLYSQPTSCGTLPSGVARGQGRNHPYTGFNGHLICDTRSDGGRWDTDFNTPSDAISDLLSRGHWDTYAYSAGSTGSHSVPGAHGHPNADARPYSNHRRPSAYLHPDSDPRGRPIAHADRHRDTHPNANTAIPVSYTEPHSAAHVRTRHPDSDTDANSTG